MRAKKKEASTIMPEASKLYDFISIWLDELNDEIQDYPASDDEYEEYSKIIDVQKDIIIWFTNTITNLITDEEEKKRFNTLTNVVAELSS